MEFQDRVVVVTGGSDGIGLALSRGFAERGARVVMVARNADRLARAAEEIGRGTEFIPLDLAGREAADRLCELLHGRGLSPSVLINNAGLARFTPFEECGPELLDLHLRLNLRTPFLLTRALLPSLKEGRGCVINVSSYFARRMVAGTPSAAYSASKGAIESLTRALAFELGPLGVRVNAIAPGTVDTPLVRGNLAIDAAEADARFAALAQRLYPLQRIGRPEDVAEAALFLASPAASWITGAVVAVDGGLTLH